MSKPTGMTLLPRTLLVAMGLALAATMFGASGARAGHTLCSALIEEVVREVTNSTGEEGADTGLSRACASQPGY